MYAIRSYYAEVVQALNILLILHADHEQNCSTAAVRLVGSARVNLYASVGAGICALWGPLHGGANQMVIEMLEDIRDSGKTVREYVESVKNSKGKELLRITSYNVCYTKLLRRHRQKLSLGISFN